VGPSAFVLPCHRLACFEWEVLVHSHSHHCPAPFRVGSVGTWRVCTLLSSLVKTNETKKRGKRCSRHVDVVHLVPVRGPRCVCSSHPRLTIRPSQLAGSQSPSVRVSQLVGGPRPSARWWSASLGSLAICVSQPVGGTREAYRFLLPSRLA
jgi:hypothetical protein